MAEYQFLGEGNAVPYDAFGYTVLRKFIDVADLVLYPQKLALASTPTVPLSAFTGFASGDILNVFHIPAGFVGVCGGSYIETADSTQTTAAFAIGDGGNTAGFQAAAAVDGASWQGTLDSDAYGGATRTGYGYIVADTIDLLFSVQTMIDAAFHVYIIGCKAFDLLGADV